MQNIFNAILNNFRLRKGLFLLLVALCTAFIVVGVITAINFDNGVLPIDLGNVAYIKFLRNGGFGSLIFGTIVANFFVYAIILLCGCKKFLLPISFVFYLYLVFSMGVIFTSVIIIYGFFATIIFLILLLAYFVLQILVLTAIMCEIIYAPHINYFRHCFSGWQSNVFVLTVLYFALSLMFCLILFLLRHYILLLVF